MFWSELLSSDQCNEYTTSGGVCCYGRVERERVLVAHCHLLAEEFGRAACYCSLGFGFLGTRWAACINALCWKACQNPYVIFLGEQQLVVPCRYGEIGF